MKRLLGAAVLALLLATGASAQAAYDSAKVKDAMHVNFSSLGAAKKAIEVGDDKAAAAAFQAILDADKPLLGLNPPKGTKADWDKAFNALLASAQKGKDAAVAKNWDAAKAALAEVRAAMGSGHAAFR